MFAKGRITTTGDVFRDEKSLAFDGSNDYISIPETTYDVDGGTVSFTFWIKILDNSVQNLVMSANPNLKNINMHSNGSMYIETNTNEDSASAPFTQDSNWHHYAITCNSGTVAMYEDGKALTMGDNTVTDDITFLRISSSTSKPFNGNISEIAIYNCTLSANQVKTIYNGREPYNHKEGVASGNLTSWYRMGDATDFAKDYGFIIPDQMSRGINTIKSWDFSSDVDGWTGYSGNTLEHSTAITNHLGGSGVVKCINADNGDKFIGGRSSALTDSDPGIEANKHYLIEYYLYVPTSWSGTTNIRLQEASMSGKTYANDVVLIDYSVKDSWQYGSNIFSPTSGDLGGFIYLQAIATTNFEADDFVYLSGVTLKEIDSKNGKMTNMDITDIEGDTP